MNCFSESVILRNWSFQFFTPVVWDLKGCRKGEIFKGKYLEISQKNYMEVIENILRYVKKISQNQKMSYFSSLFQLQISISQNVCTTCSVLFKCITYIDDI